MIVNIPAEQFTLFVLIDTKCVPEGTLVAAVPEFPSMLIFPPVWEKEELLATIKLPLIFNTPPEIFKIPNKLSVLFEPPEAPMVRLPEVIAKVPVVAATVNPPFAMPVILTLPPPIFNAPLSDSEPLIFKTLLFAVSEPPDEMVKSLQANAEPVGIDTLYPLGIITEFETVGTAFMSQVEASPQLPFAIAITTGDIGFIAGSAPK